MSQSQRNWIIVIILFVFVLWWMIFYFLWKQTDNLKRKYQNENNTNTWITRNEEKRIIEEAKTYDMEEYKSIREQWFIMVHWQKVEITDKTSDQDIQYFIDYSWLNKWKWKIIEKDEYNENRKKLFKEFNENDPDLSYHEIYKYVMNAWIKAKDSTNPEIRFQYYVIYKDIENWLKDKDKEVVKRIQNFKKIQEEKENNK